MVKALTSSEYPTMVGKNFRFAVFRLLENVFVNLPPLSLLALVPLCRTPPPPANFPQKVCPTLKDYFRKKSTHTLGGDTMISIGQKFRGTHRICNGIKILFFLMEDFFLNSLINSYLR